MIASIPSAVARWGLARADGPQQDNVARGWDPGAAPELLDPCALEAVCAFPIELGEGLLSRQSRGVKAALDSALGPRGQLGVEHRAQVLKRRPRLGERLARERIALASDGGQLEHAGLRAHCGEEKVGVGHAETLSSSAS